MNTKDKIFYTYGYMSKQGNIYYIGKGKDGRFYEKSHGRVQIPTDRSRIVFFRKDSLHMYAEPQLMLEREALDREIELIKHYGRKDLNEGHLLNLTDGGEGPSGYKRTEESKKKQSITSKKTGCCAGENNGFFNKKHTEEGKKKKSIISKDWWANATDEEKPDMRGKKNGMYGKKMSDMRPNYKHIGNSGKKNGMYGVRLTGEKNGMYGKKHTEESLAKMSKSHSKNPMTGEKNPMFGKTHTPKTRKFLSLINSGKNNARYGRKHTEETLAKMRAAWVRRKEKLNREKNDK